MLAGKPAVRRRARRGGDKRSGKPRKIVLSIKKQDKGLLIGKDVLAEFGAERRKAFVDPGEPCFGGLRQSAAISHKGGMIAVKNPQLLGAKAKSRPLRVERGDALKQLAAQIDLTLIAGEPRRDLLLKRLKSVIGIGRCKIEENRANTAEIAAAPLQRPDCIFERRRAQILRDRRHLGPRAGERGLERLLEMAWSDLFKRWRLKRPCPWRKQRVLRKNILLFHGTLIQFRALTQNHSITIFGACRARPFSRLAFTCAAISR